MLLFQCCCGCFTDLLVVLLLHCEWLLSSRWPPWWPVLGWLVAAAAASCWFEVLFVWWRALFLRWRACILVVDGSSVILLSVRSAKFITRICVQDTLDTFLCYVPVTCRYVLVTCCYVPVTWRYVNVTCCCVGMIRSIDSCCQDAGTR